MPRRPATSIVSPKPAVQRRSELTQARILAATEALLAESDTLTMEQIAERAHVSVGAIYKRFQGKDSLLPLVLARVHDQQFQLITGFLASPRWADADLATRIAALLETFATCQVSRQRLIRALVVGHWQSHDRSSTEMRSAELITLMLRWLGERSDEIAHPHPSLALSLGLFTILQSLQTAILFDRIPPQIGVAGFLAEMTRMFQRYLGLASPMADSVADAPRDHAADIGGGAERANDSMQAAEAP